MATVLVKIDNCKGEVSYECNSETSATLTTTFRWFEGEHEDGFIVVDDSMDIFPILIPGVKLPVTEIASEVFLLLYLAIICQFYRVDPKNITYVADYGIHIKTLSFIPPSITRDDEKGDILCREFPQVQSTLRDIWQDYKSNNILTAAHIEVARDADVLEDFISLINLQNILNFGELENEHGITT